MFEEQFIKLEPGETKEILEIINPMLDIGPINPDNSVIMAIDLPFYENSRFFDIADHSQNPVARIFAVYHKKTKAVTILDWSNQTIYNLNETFPIELNEKTVESYVKFFFTYVKGKHGRFIVIDNIDDIPWKEDPPPPARRAISKMLSPVTLDNKDENGFHLIACMLFRDSLFKTKIHVDQTGKASMTDEELLIEDMPVLDDMFGQ